MPLNALKHFNFVIFCNTFVTPNSKVIMGNSLCKVAWQLEKSLLFSNIQILMINSLFGLFEYKRSHQLCWKNIIITIVKGLYICFLCNDHFLQKQNEHPMNVSIFKTSLKFSDFLIIDIKLFYEWNVIIFLQMLILLRNNDRFIHTRIKVIQDTSANSKIIWLYKRWYNLG